MLRRAWRIAQLESHSALFRSVIHDENFAVGLHVTKMQYYRYRICNENAVFASMIAILRQTPRPHVPQKASLSYAAAGPSRRESSAHRAYSDPKSSAHRACATNFIAASQNAICCNLADNLYRNNAKCLFLQDATKALATIGSLNLVQTHPFQRQSARGCGLRRFVACALSAVRAFLFPVAEE